MTRFLILSFVFICFQNSYSETNLPDRCLSMIDKQLVTLGMGTNLYPAPGVEKRYVKDFLYSFEREGLSVSLISLAMEKPSIDRIDLSLESPSVLFGGNESLNIIMNTECDIETITIKLHRSSVTVDSDVCDSFNSRNSFINTKDWLKMISRKYTQNPKLKLKSLAEENMREAVRLQCETIKEFI